MDYIEMSDEQRHWFEKGRDAERNNFRANPHRDLSQDVFKCETADYKLHVSYDDVEGSYYLRVLLKDRLTKTGDRVDISVEFGSYAAAMTRAVRYMRKHPAPRPVCYVDY